MNRAGAATPRPRSARIRAGGARARLRERKARFAARKGFDGMTRAALVAYRAASDAAAKGAMFVVTVAAARRLDAQAFGLFSIAATGGWMLAVAADCGIGLHAARVVSRRPDRVAAVVRQWLPARLWLTAATVAIAIASVAFGALPLRDAVAMVLIAGSYLAAGWLEFLYYVFRGLDRSDLESSIVLLHRAALFVCALGVLAWSPRLWLLGASMAVPAAVALAAAAHRLRHLGPWRASGGVRDLDAPPLAAVRSVFVRDVLPIGAGIVLSAVYFRVDLLMVAAWAGVDAAGQYNAVFRLVEALRLFPAALLAVVLPAVFRATTARTLADLSTGLALFGVVVGAAGILTAPWLVRTVYGGRYDAAVPALRILMLAFPLLCVNYALTHQLIGWQGGRAYAAVCAAALAVNIVLNARWIPAMGFAGAAWATFWTEVVVAGGCLVGLRTAAPRTAEAVTS
jgi:O-antigen/teichoic acid export membrane protein